jgi:hypothetical protein
MTRDLPNDVTNTGEPGVRPGDVGPDSGGQSGDTQGLSRDIDAAEESVEELVAEGQDYEAGILNGVEDATDHPGVPVPNRGL